MSWWKRRRSKAIVATVGLVLLAAAAAGEFRPIVERIRYVGTVNYSRVVVDLSAPARYSVASVPGDGQATPVNRLVIDVEGAAIGPEAREPLSIGDALLQRIRTGQFTPGTARIVLDFRSLADHHVFTLPDPYRLVIDMRGSGPSRIPDAAEVLRLDSTHASPAEARPLPAARPAPRAPEPARVPSAATASANEHRVPTLAALPPPGSARRLKVMLDPGHGGKDPGARGIGGVLEKDVVLSIARELAAHLRDEAGVEVVLTRNDDRFLSLEERTGLANALEADLFVSIHANASARRATRGIEVYYLNNTANRGTLRLAAMENNLRWNPADAEIQEAIPDLSYILSDLRQTYKVEESRVLADHLGGAMVQRLRGRYDGVGPHEVREGPFYVLVGAYMPCVLVEVSYLTNPVEGARLGSPGYRRTLAEGLLEGIRGYLRQTRMAKNL